MRASAAMSGTGSASSPPLLERLCLHRPELRAWALYDWANSVFMTTVLMIFPIYYATTAAQEIDPAVRSARFAWATTLALAAVALLAPILGAIADFAGLKKRMLAVFLGLGVSCTAALALVARGDWLAGLVLFALANVGVSGSIVFADSLLPHVARPDEVDRVASAGFALGYLGGALLFALNIAWIQWPAAFGFDDAATATRASFASAGVWWLVFSLPLLRKVPEPAVAGPRGSAAAAVLGGLRNLRRTLGELSRYREAFLFLAAVLVYNDGIATVIRMASLYGTEIGIATGPMMLALLVVQLVGVPFTFLFGALAGRIGPKRAILLALGVYGGITVYAYFMRTATQFFAVAALVGTVQGGSQALSRSLFASLIPRHRSSEFFGFFGIFEKFAGILGPAVFAATITLTGSSRPAILALFAFFAVGALLLARVDVAGGRRAAREAEAAGA